MKKIKLIYDEVMQKIKNEHIVCFKDMDEPLFLISEQYPGLWMEHIYDSVLLARMDNKYINIAENAINLFIERQKENGQLPFVIIDRNKRPELSENKTAKYSQIQECVSFFSLAFEVYEMNNDKDFLAKVYESGKKWDNWLRTYRITTNRGLVEMFVGYDTGHDNSGRLDGLSYKGNYSIDGVVQDADKLPPSDGITPILAVDMNCNFFGNEKALAKMAKELGKDDEAISWDESADEIKKKIFEYLYDGDDAFFYDVDRNGNKRKCKSSIIFHLFLEKVLDKELDKEIIERIYNEHIKNPEEFWTPFPFPSMAINDPTVKAHKESNSWGYYTQGLIVLRCTRWMDYYGFGKDQDYICEKWVQTWTQHFDRTKLSQEIDPITGMPTNSSEWYSSSMLYYVYSVRRLGLI